MLHPRGNLRRATGDVDLRRSVGELVLAQRTNAVAERELDATADLHTKSPAFVLLHRDVVEVALGMRHRRASSRAHDADNSVHTAGICRTQPAPSGDVDEDEIQAV